MKKRYVIILCMAFLFLLLTGCGGEEETSDAPSEPTYKVDMHVDFKKNLLFDKKDLDLIVDNEKEGYLLHGENADFELNLTEGEHKIVFRSDDKEIMGETSLNILSDVDCAYRVSCTSDEVTIEELYVDYLGELSEDKVKTEGDKELFIDKNYKEVEQTFRDWGFENIRCEPVYDIVFGITDEGTIKEVTVNGDDTFKKGSIYQKDAEVVITYSMPEEDDPANATEATTEATTEEVEEESDDDSPVFYSTNTSEVAKAGKSGVFAYKSKGGSYDIYYIIDFDEGYIYSFTEGNGEETADKVKIESGNLNDKVIVNYDFDGDIATYGFHFKYVNHPEHLIMEDDDHFDYDFYTTDLNDALSVRNKKRIIDR